MNVISLFGGIETGYLTFKELGVTNYYSSEIDKYAKAIARHNFPNIIDLGDITLLTNEELDKLPIIDWVIGGSPCQSFSTAGNQKGFEGKSGLFYEYLRVLKFLKDKNPNLNFLLENVRMKKEWMNQITSELLTVYDEVFCKPLNSNLVSGQNRQRLYWTNFQINDPDDKNIYLKDILETGVTDKSKSYCIDASYKRNANLYGYFKKSRGSLVFNAIKDSTDFRNKTEKELLSKAERNKTNYRILTPIECERLQTLPDNYTKFGNFEGVVKEISDTQRYKCIGNGWTHEIIKHIVLSNS